jgi:hypothetical protein
LRLAEDVLGSEAALGVALPTAGATTEPANSFRDHIEGQVLGGTGFQPVLSDLHRLEAGATQK